MNKKSLVIIIAVVVAVAVIIYLLYRHFMTTHTTTTPTTTSTITTTPSPTTTSPTTTSPTITSPTTSTTQTSTSPTSPTSSSGNVYIIKNPCNVGLDFLLEYKQCGSNGCYIFYGVSPGQTYTVSIDWNEVASMSFININGQQIPANVSGNAITPAYCPSPITR